MKSIKLKYIFFVFLIAMAGCRKDEKTDELVVIEPIGDPTIEVVSGVTGFVANEDGTSVSNATVSIYNRQVKTDENGIFYVNNVGLNKINSIVHVEKGGYFDGYKSFIPSLGKKSYVQLQLVKRGNFEQIASSTGGSVSINGGAELILPGNSIVLKNGGAGYTGDVNVYTHWYDPTNLDIGRSMPGNLLGITSDGKETQLGTYGMIAVELETSAGEALQLAAGSKATLKFPVPSSLDPPSTIVLWSFDELDAHWVQEGIAKLENGFYVAEVSHFSFWNCDAPFPLINIVGRVLYNGFPIANFPVTITIDNLISGFGYTDNEGVFRGKVPKGENLLLTMSQCGGTIVSQELGSFENDKNIGDIAVNLQNFETVLKGRLVGCFDQPLENAYGLIGSNEKVNQVITPLADGTFITTLFGCGNANYTVQFIDPENLNSTGIIDISKDVEIQDLMDVRICEGLDEFILYEVNGIAAPLITAADVYYSNGEKLIIRGEETNVFGSFDMDVYLNAIGVYNPSSMSIQGIVGPNNPELQMMCGDHITNAFGCDQFEVTITSFNDYVVGTFSGVLVTYQDPIGYDPLEFDEYSIQGSFRLKIDETITTGEISGVLWFDENSSNTRDDDENRAMRAKSVSLSKISGDEQVLFPQFLKTFNNFYNFTDLIPGTYIVRVYNQDDYEVVVRDIGSDDRDSDFEVDGNFFASDERIIFDSDNILNVDLGFKIPTSLICGAWSYFGCKPNITIVSNFAGGLPPYTATLNDGQIKTSLENPVFVVTDGGFYEMDMIDAAGNQCQIGRFVDAYNNRISGYVWTDTDVGIPNIFDFNDIGLNDFLVFLYNENGELIQETLSENGRYLFSNVTPGNHYIEIEVSGSLQILDQNTNVINGNDINPSTRRSNVFLIGECDSFTQIDVGLKSI